MHRLGRNLLSLATRGPYTAWSVSPTAGPPCEVASTPPAGTWYRSQTHVRALNSPIFVHKMPAEQRKRSNHWIVGQLSLGQILTGGPWSRTYAVRSDSDLTSYSENLLAEGIDLTHAGQCLASFMLRGASPWDGDLNGTDSFPTLPLPKSQGQGAY
jgi:hypothetical protein